jgi:flagellar biosynthesis chaperone FliJ
MTKPEDYPLAQLLTIKQNRFDQAVKILEEKKLLLEKAYEKLYDLTQAKDKVLNHKIAKLTQLREELDRGTSSDKIQQMKAYLKVVDTKLAEEEKKVADQKRQVNIAQSQVDTATDELFQRKKDLEKLEIHKKEWEKESRYWIEQKEGILHDEQGASMHHLRQKEEELRKKNREKNDNQ